MKEGFIALGLALTIMYAIINGIDASFGYNEGFYPSKYRTNKCKLPPTRGDILFPGYRFGCWLSKPAFKEEK